MVRLAQSHKAQSLRDFVPSCESHKPAPRKRACENRSLAQILNQVQHRLLTNFETLRRKENLLPGLPRHLAPANIAAAKPTLEINLVNRSISLGLRFGGV